MTRKIFFISLVCAVLSVKNLSAQNADIIQYVNTYKLLAIREMQRTGIPASIKLAQGILETQAGTSDLVMRSNNHFGIKCKTGWSGNKVYHDDDERGECFRAYSSAEDSYRDHSDFLKTSQRYAFLFQLDPEDYEGWAKGLKKAGYATNPRYTQQVVKYIEDYNLQLYTMIALGKRKMEDESPMYAVNNNKPSIIPAVALSSGEKRNTKVIQETAAPSAPVLPVKYPEGEFRINDTKVIFAVAGTPLLALAEEYSVKYKHLLDFNELSENEDIVRKDQLIYLQRKRKQGASEFHIVQKGETLYDIAQKEAIRLENLLSYNELAADEIPAVSQKIFLQKDAARQAAEEASQSNIIQDVVKTEQEAPVASSAIKSSLKHIVQSKETLYSIAKKYEVEIDQLRSWNRLQHDDIKTGQELVIYKN